MNFIINRLKSIFLMFIGIWRRALCCFRRKRRLSCEGIPLTTVDVISNNVASSSGVPIDSDIINWNVWDETHSQRPKPNSIQEHIDQYRQQAVAARLNMNADELIEEQQDLFQDMAPKLTKQIKVVIQTSEDNRDGLSSSRLAPDPIYTGNQLGEWVESGGWEEENLSDLNPDQVLKEKRRQERERRLWEQQQKRQQKHTRPVILGSKINS